MPFLVTPSASSNHTLTIPSADDVFLFKNVAIGEVWLCAGQSNMGWSVANSFEAEGELTVDLPQLRLFKSSREHWHEPLPENRDQLASWKPENSESAAETSAVSYYFGKTLHQHLGIPIGIIERAYAGTPIEGWLPWEVQEGDPRMMAHKQRYDENAIRQIEKAGETKENSLVNFRKELADYHAKIAAGETRSQGGRRISPPIITKPADLGHQYPAHIFNAMIHPVVPYGIRGMIWYQGERNGKHSAQAFHYRQQLPMLIGHYRRLWHEGSNGHVPLAFPFQVTQLPSWHSPQTKPVEGIESPWIVSRDSMNQVADSLPNTGLVVTIDTGDPFDLHPKNKKPIGLRHAYLALAQTYGLDVPATGPQLDGFERKASTLHLHFSGVGSGLALARPSDPLDSFAIAGSDQVWHWAHATMDRESIVLSHPDVPSPLAARYAWGMNPSQRNLLYNAEGFPASPFRTDDWPLFDPEAEPVEIIKPKTPEGYESSDWRRPLLTMGEARSNEEPPRLSHGHSPSTQTFQAQKSLSYLATPYLTCSPMDQNDGLPVGTLDRPGTKEALAKLLAADGEDEFGNLDSLLLWKDGKLIFEMYARRGRIDGPHYAMSITKTLTSVTLARAMKLGFLSLEDLDQPIIDFMPEIDRSHIQPGVETITLRDALFMKSGLRFPNQQMVFELGKQYDRQAYFQKLFETTSPVTPKSKEYKYTGVDPSLIMMIIDIKVGGNVQEFIRQEIADPLAIPHYVWGPQGCGIPKCGAGSNFTSRSLLKIGSCIIQGGIYNGQQLLDPRYVRTILDPSKGEGYFYFFHNRDKLPKEGIDFFSGIGAGGQYMAAFPELNLVAVATAHTKNGIGKPLNAILQYLVPLFQ
ncbi:MAG: serine hydrolase [Verrucomicrobiota bacterium]